MLIAAFVIVGVLLLLASILSISDNLINIEAQKEGIDTTKQNVGLLPSIGEAFGGKGPSGLVKGHYHKLKKGFDLKLSGEASGEPVEANVIRFAVKPTDYRGISPIPKLEVEVGDDVKAGDTLFYDKPNPELKYVAPVSGEVVEIRRGAKRSISHIIILADKNQQYKLFDPPSLDASREEIVEFLIGSGLWPSIIQRPFDLVPEPSAIPDNIFISTFNTAPLALDLNLTVDGKEAYFQKGIDVLGKLTPGKVYLGLDGRKGHTPHPGFSLVENAEKHYFDGKHPAGNVGIQMHHVKPIKGIAIAWTLNVDSVIQLGKLMSEGRYDSEKLIAITGSQLKENIIFRTHSGASIDELTKGLTYEDGSETRLISGDVLSGTTALEDDFISARNNQITAIEEGNKYELFGWMFPVTPRPSTSKTFPNFLVPDHKFDGNTNTHGEQRAFVVTGQYEKVLPMDIYPQHLMKAILTGDIEKMEGLGINELSEEDIALCEFACTSKQPLQSILRDGLEMMREQA